MDFPIGIFLVNTPYEPSESFCCAKPNFCSVLVQLAVFFLYSNVLFFIVSWDVVVGFM